jgi:hypothetical protein
LEAADDTIGFVPTNPFDFYSNPEDPEDGLQAHRFSVYCTCNFEEVTVDG